jgi:pimeloyl-ACP methyl ester carboxylesterase
MRARLLVPAALSVVIGACGGVTPPPTLPAPGTSAPTAPEPSTTVAAPITPVPTGVEADIDVGGRTMRLVCAGPTDVKEPTILLEAGLGDDHRPWADVLRAMEPEHRLCAYDRAGLGQSEPAAERSRTAADQVADLRALLDAADLHGPFVLGAHSYGPIVAILFTRAYPDDVAGLLFVDPRSPRVSARFRAALPDVAENEPDGLMQLRYSLDAFETDPVLNRENLNLAQSYEEANAALDTPGPFFGDRPVIVLSAGSSLAAQAGVPPDLAPTLDGIWRATQQELADESTAGSLEVVPGSGHYIQTDRPQAVIDGLERILGDLATP